MTKKTLILAGVYQHYKGGLYRVIGIARHSETQELMVVYKSQSKEYDLWVRPYEMFREHIEVDGKKVPRFKFLHY